MIVTVAGSPVEPSRIDVCTLPQTGWAFIATPPVTVSVGDPVEITTRDGAPVLTGEVAKVERSWRHLRIVARPAVLADMDRRTVGPITLQDSAVPDVLTEVLGPHQVTVLPPIDTARMALWSTRERSQRWSLESIMRALRHDGEAVAWRFDARADRLVVFAPGGDEQRVEHAVERVLMARGGAVEVGAVDNQVQAGDILNGAEVRECKTIWMRRPSVKRSLVWTAAA